jgi:transcriptional regulator with XRE-family HTH domain
MPTISESPRSAGTQILHPEFAARLNAVANTNATVPPSNYGRLGWFAEEFAKRNMVVSKEMVRKYFAGENKPRAERMDTLAEILQVDVAWLSLGKSAVAETSRNAIRNGRASGAVNVVAGLIQLHGGSPAFPEDGDVKAESEHVDLFAIIRGAQYAIHVALGEQTDQGTRFSLPVSMGGNTIVLGVIQTSPLCFDIVELDSEGLAEHGKPGKSAISVTIDADYRTESHAWRRVETFAKRL